ncbi:YcjF family protein [Deinococcus sp. Marseille-Q6407]|uniref:YcjF family protein n=1 Tax=Deinococcus sp. Marseille-Q6407 TaxID=2969223 RepID=UPI0021BEE0E6|nr:YcjF family protein [Deinococcus sp. Marseille-Q6407]
MLPPIVSQIMDNFNFDVDPDLSREQNAEEVIKNAALLSGAVSIEPLPFADMLILTPLQAKMVLHIGKIYGFDITLERSAEIARELGVTVAYGMAARQFMRGVAKIALPVVGGVVTAPLVYGWTFALGRMAQTYFERKVQGLPFRKDEQVQVVQEAKQQSRRVLPSSEDFSELAEELRRRAKQRGDQSKDGSQSSDQH